MDNKVEEGQRKCTFWQDMRWCCGYVAVVLDVSYLIVLGTDHHETVNHLSLYACIVLTIVSVKWWVVVSAVLAVVVAKILVSALACA